MDYIISEDKSKLVDFQLDLEATDVIYLDTETTGLDTLIAEMILLQVLVNGKIYIFNCRKLEPKYVIYLTELIKESGKTCVGQNIKYDVKVIKSSTGILLENVYDTFISEVIVTNGIGTKYPALKYLVKKYTDGDIDKDIRLDFADRNLILKKEHYEYAAKDLIYLEEIRNKQIEEITNTGQEKILELEMKFLPVLAQMELNGVYLNKDKWKEIANIYQKKADEQENIVKNFFMDNVDFSKYESLLEATKEIGIFKDKEGKNLRAKFRQEELSKIKDVELAKKYIYENLNIDSNSQIKNILCLAGIEVQDTLAGTLKKKYKKYPITENIVKYREFQKRVTTYGEEFISSIHPKTGRVHAQYHQYGTASGRLSCKDPNMQNIPAQDEYRACFEAEAGNKFITIDYSQQEYRIIGEFTGEQTIIDAYNAGKDMHIVTAALVNNISIEEVTKQQRQDAKAINFGLFYGINEYGLKYRLGITLKESIRIMTAVFGGMPRFVSFRAAFENIVVDKGYSVTMAGRRRYFKTKDKYIDGSDYLKTIGKIKREGFNHPIQGTGADMTKLAMCYCHYNNPFGDKFKLVTQGHDEIGFEVSEDIVKEAEEFAKKEMIKAGEKFIKSMPVEVEGVIKNHWSKG
jgi:DNA polymerase-1